LADFRGRFVIEDDPVFSTKIAAFMVAYARVSDCAGVAGEKLIMINNYGIGGVANDRMSGDG